MMRALIFNRTDELDRVWDYQIVETADGLAARLWYRAPWDKVWQFGHSKDIPANWTFATTAQHMRAFIVGEIDFGYYNTGEEFS